MAVPVAIVPRMLDALLYIVLEECILIALDRLELTDISIRNISAWKGKDRPFCIHRHIRGREIVGPHPFHARSSQLCSNSRGIDKEDVFYKISCLID